MRVPETADASQSPSAPKRRPIPTSRIEGYRKQLTDLADTLNRGLAHDRRQVMQMEEPDLPTGPMPSSGEIPDSGTMEIETGVMASGEKLLAEVNAALARIDAGTFGQCEACGKTITKARLDALPHVRHCIRCAKKIAAPAR